MNFFYIGNHKDITKVSRLRGFFVVEIFKIHRLVWIFLWIFCCFKLLHQCFALS
jgi:hypothetical protein